MEEVKILELRILSVESNLDASLNLETNLCLVYDLCGIRYVERQPLLALGAIGSYPLA